MSTYDLSKAPNALYPIASQNQGYFRKHTIDIGADMATHVTGDIAKVIAIAAGEFVAGVYVRIVTASTTGSSTVTVGDTASGTNWITSLSTTATADTVTAANGANMFTQSGTTPFAVTWVGGKQYTTADTIQVVLGGTAPANGVIEVVVDIIPMALTGATY